jgi:hypothetical protein
MCRACFGLQLLDDAPWPDLGPVRLLVPAGPSVRPDRRCAVRARPHRAGGAGEHARRRRGRALPRGHRVPAQLHGQHQVPLHLAAGEGRVRRRAPLRRRPRRRGAGRSVQDGERGPCQVLVALFSGRRMAVWVWNVPWSWNA